LKPYDLYHKTFRTLKLDGFYVLIQKVEKGIVYAWEKTEPTGKVWLPTEDSYQRIEAEKEFLKSRKVTGKEKEEIIKDFIKWRMDK